MLAWASATRSGMIFIDIAEVPFPYFCVASDAAIENRCIAGNTKILCEAPKALRKLRGVWL
jgi:hypothetical protein